MSILFPKYKMKAYRYGDGVNLLTERGDFLGIFEQYKGKGNYYIEISSKNQVVYTESPETIKACEQQLDDVTRRCKEGFKSTEEAAQILGSLNDFPEYPKFPVKRIDDGAEEYIERKSNHHDKRLALYTELITARNACTELDSNFVSSGQVQSFKDNRKLMNIYDHAISDWRVQLSKVFDMQDIATAEKEAKRKTAAQDDLSENLDLEI